MRLKSICIICLTLICVLPVKADALSSFKPYRGTAAMTEAGVSASVSVPMSGRTNVFVTHSGVPSSVNYNYIGSAAPGVSAPSLSESSTASAFSVGGGYSAGVYSSTARQLGRSSALGTSTAASPISSTSFSTSSLSAANGQSSSRPAFHTATISSQVAYTGGSFNTASVSTVATVRRIGAPTATNSSDLEWLHNWVKNNYSGYGASITEYNLTYSDLQAAYAAWCAYWDSSTMGTNPYDTLEKFIAWVNNNSNGRLWKDGTTEGNGNVQYNYITPVGDAILPLVLCLLAFAVYHRRKSAC